MTFSIRLLLCIAMPMLSLVSMWTTYASLNDSILPEPKVGIPLFDGAVWQCSIVALGLSVAIGLMLLALKIAIVGGQKRLNIAGILGLTVVAFISITFNMDVLYRTADKDFYLRYSNDQMRGAYEEFLAEAQGVLLARRTELLRGVAKQEGELAAEVKGLRRAPAGYGQQAREEEYKLTLLQKENEVELEAVTQALAVKAEADELLRAAMPTSLEDIDRNQSQLRVVIKDMAALSGVRMPDQVRTESPLFAVFAKLMDFNSVGFKEVFFLILAFLLDLGDVIGYSLVPNARLKKRTKTIVEPMPGRHLALVPEEGDALFPRAATHPLPSGPPPELENLSPEEEPPPPVLARRRSAHFRLGRR